VIFIIIIIIIIKYFTAQELEICRTPGPIACLKMLNKVCLKNWRKEKKIPWLDLGSLEPAAIRFFCLFH